LIPGVVILSGAGEITYNPYKYTSFVFKGSEAEYTGSKWCALGSIDEHFVKGPRWRCNTTTINVRRVTVAN
jgi:hypothetical protein